MLFELFSNVYILRLLAGLMPHDLISGDDAMSCISHFGSISLLRLKNLIHTRLYETIFKLHCLQAAMSDMSCILSIVVGLVLLFIIAYKCLGNNFFRYAKNRTTYLYSLTSWLYAMSL